jgi:hypothetical protein
VYSFRQEEKTVVIASVVSAARAEFLQVTLAAHGITSSYAPFSMYPSVDFVEGVGVSVRIEDELRARQILSTLGLDSDPETPESEDPPT